MHGKSVPINESPFFIYISFLPALVSKLHDVESSLIGFIPTRHEVRTELFPKYNVGLLTPIPLQSGGL